MDWENKHTPGSWSVDWQSPCYWLIRYDGVHLPPSESTDCPNRRLIAAAPETKKQRDELLTALDSILHHAYDEDTPVEDIKADFDRMRGIAAKAINNATSEEA